MTEMDKTQKIAKRSYSGLVVRAFVYSIIPTFVVFVIGVNMGISANDAVARGFVGFMSVIFGVLMIQKRIAMGKVLKK